MNEKEKIEYVKLLSELEDFSNWEAEKIEKLKYHLMLKNGKKTPVIQTYEERLEISGLHIKHSVYHEPQAKGFLRTAEAIAEGLEKRKESLIVRERLEKEIASFCEKFPSATLEDDDAILELSRILEKYQDEIKTREDSYRRRINEFKSLVNANWESWTHFITLTFRKNMTDIEKAQRYFSEWTKLMNKEFDDFLFVSVKEFQQRGSIHFHCLVRIKKKMSLDEFHKVRNFWTDLDKPIMGNPDIKSVMVKYVPQEHVSDSEWKEKRERHIWSLGNYLTSYLKKGAADPRLFGKKLFTSSSKKKLKQKVVITDKEKIHQTLRAIEVDGLKKNSYEIKERYIDKNTGNVITGNENIGEMHFYNVLLKNDEKK